MDEMLKSFINKNVIKFKGHRETWYSQKLLPEKNLNIPGRHPDARGLIVDKDGYIVVRALLVPIGGTIETFLGMGKCYGTSTTANFVDIYTNW